MSTGPQGPQGTAGTNGTNGTNGNTILFGPSNPSNSATGVNGNFYINTTNFTLFGPKTAGDSGDGVSLLGTGLQTGGTAGQILTKIDGTDFNTGWEDNSFANLSGNATDNTSLATALATKEDKVAGYQLSQENYTTAEKNKLATLSEHYKGTYTSQTALSTANPTGNPGDYAYVDLGLGDDAKVYIWDEVNTDWALSSGNVIPDATEIAPGIIELATIAEALARTDDQRAMTALKTISLILDEKKNVYYQIAPVSLNEVSFLMRNAGNITAITISGASNAKLKIGIGGTYPTGAQTFPFAYAAGDRVFVTFTYTDLNNANCNIILTCRDN